MPTAAAAPPQPVSLPVETPASNAVAWLRAVDLFATTLSSLAGSGFPRRASGAAARRLARRRPRFMESLPRPGRGGRPVEERGVAAALCAVWRDAKSLEEQRKGAAAHHRPALNSCGPRTIEASSIERAFCPCPAGARTSGRGCSILFALGVARVARCAPLRLSRESHDRDPSRCGCGRAARHGCYP